MFFKSIKAYIDKKNMPKTTLEETAYENFFKNSMLNNKITENSLKELNNNIQQTNDNIIIKFLKKRQAINLTKIILAMPEEEKNKILTNKPHFSDLVNKEIKKRK